MNIHYSEIKDTAYHSLHNIFGKAPPNGVEDRFETELELLRTSEENTLAFYTAMRICAFAKSQGRIYSYRRYIANSLIAYLVGITDINPIEYGLPYELICADHHMRRRVDIDIIFPDDFYDSVITYLKEMFEEDYVFCPEDGNYKNKYTVVYHYSEKFEDDDVFAEIDILPDKNLTLLEKLINKTGVSIGSIPICDERTLALINDLDVKDIPFLDNPFITELVGILKPKSYGELLKIISLGHCTNVWNGNAEHLYYDGTLSLMDIPSSRDDIYLLLKAKGVADGEAYLLTRIWNAIERVEMKPWIIEMSETHRLPSWWLPFVAKAIYFCSKGLCISCLNTALRIAYFKAQHCDTFDKIIGENKERGK